MSEENKWKAAKSPETMLDEAVERNEDSIRRVQSRIEHLQATLNQLEDLQTTFSDRKLEGHRRKPQPTRGRK